METNETPKLLIAHKEFRDYYFDKFDEYFSSTPEEKQQNFKELFEAAVKDFSKTVIHKYDPTKYFYNISTHLFNKNEDVGFFENSVIHIIEPPIPTQIGEPYFIAVGVASPPNIYSTIIPFYWLLEYAEGGSAVFTEYKFDDDNCLKKLTYKKQVKNDVNSFIKAIADRLKKFSFKKIINSTFDEKGNEVSYRVYGFVDEIEGSEEILICN
jgi:hypothetical protein